MLQELLDTRVMVKNSMKLHNKLANQDPGKQAFFRAYLDTIWKALLIRVYASGIFDVIWKTRKILWIPTFSQTLKHFKYFLVIWHDLMLNFKNILREDL